MSFRDESIELPCGCKIGRSKGGLWYYDYLCEIHLPEVLDNSGRYSFEKAEELTRKLNEEMREIEKKRTSQGYGVDVVLKEE